MAKAVSGGGLNSRVVKRVGIRAGASSARIVDPAGLSQLGAAQGGKLRREGSFTGINSSKPVFQGTMKQVPLGNQLSTNVGKGGPGTGRTTYRAGYQGQHGAPVQGSTPTPKDTLAEYGPETSSRGSLVRR
jgi:hypothetical protein